MLRSAWRLPVRATASSWRGAQSFALRRGAQSVAEDLTRNSVFGIAQEATEDASNFQSASHDVRRKEAEWRGHDLELLERTRTKDTTALRKKLRHHARSRGWIEAAEFLAATRARIITRITTIITTTTTTKNKSQERRPLNFWSLTCYCRCCSCSYCCDYSSCSLEAAEFLVAFVDARGAELEDEEPGFGLDCCCCCLLLFVAVVVVVVVVSHEVA
ncbi:unnamed protein product [Polarella glacialis]|uniref:Uncharacterized protein n=1 Tax=Polarella glacialis TaxID=89957 RepID=A0A813E2E7_POLGL|nr:unnamed protein product [Polarella glacialis]